MFAQFTLCWLYIFTFYSIFPKIMHVIVGDMPPSLFHTFIIICERYTGDAYNILKHYCRCVVVMTRDCVHVYSACLAAAGEALWTRR